jgi:uncharacterized protein (DUF2236 family)
MNCLTRDPSPMLPQAYFWTQHDNRTAIASGVASVLLQPLV